jgi:hypothetical protein
VDLDEWEMAKREAETAAQLSLDALDLPEGLTRIRAFVVAVLEDEMTGCRTADAVVLVERGDGRLLLLFLDRVARGSSPWMSTILPTGLGLPG